MNTLMTVLVLTQSVTSEAASQGGMNWILRALIISVVIGLIAGFIRAMSLKSKLTSVYKNDSAADYTRDKSFKLELKKDTFLYSKTVKEEKPEADGKSKQ